MCAVRESRGNQELTLVYDRENVENGTQALRHAETTEQLQSQPSQLSRTRIASLLTPVKTQYVNPSARECFQNVGPSQNFVFFT